MADEETSTERIRNDEQEEDWEWPTPDLTEEEWRQFIAYCWREELEDPLQDIYTADS